MYKVIEFEDRDGGGLNIIRREWVTPRKKDTLWLPYKTTSKFNKCLSEKYETDDLIKACEKCKSAETESDLYSDEIDDGTNGAKRKRKTRHTIDSDTDEYDEDYLIVGYPEPPKHQMNDSKPPISTTDEEEDCDNDVDGPVMATDETFIANIGSLDLTLTSYLNEKTPSSQSLDVVSRHLANIEKSIEELQITQDEILTRLRSSSKTRTPVHYQMKLIFHAVTATLIELENAILIPGNDKLLDNYLSLVGGHKTSAFIRRILEITFTNNLAIICNWTGKNNKTALKDMAVINVIKNAVRLHKISEMATDAELNTIKQLVPVQQGS